MRRMCLGLHRSARLVVMMVRPPVVLVILLFAAIGMAAGGRGDGIGPLAGVSLVLAGWFVHATVLNDLGDEPIDRVNLQHAPGRPLVAGFATRRELRALGWAAAAVAVAGAALAGRGAVAVVGAGLGLNAAYSCRPVRLCDRGAVAPFVLPAGYVAVPYLLGALVTGGRLHVALLGALYAGFVGRILLKDFRDVRGDALYGKRTFLLRRGRRRTCAVSAAFSTAGVAAVLVVLPWSWVTAAGMAGLLACTLRTLSQLASGGNVDEEQKRIAAIAMTGRGMGVVVLAHLTAPAAAVGAVAALFLAAHLDSARDGGRRLEPERAY